MGNERSVPFVPIRGSESAIKAMKYNEGYIYFATDTKKIYVDAYGQPKIPMGGNSGVYYGTLNTENAFEGQLEFIFTIDNIDTDGMSFINLPNINDLIINSDGCLYRVTDIKSDTQEIITTKLSIFGGGPNANNVGKISINNLTGAELYILHGNDCELKFIIKATYPDGSYNDQGGQYRIEINGQDANLRGTIKTSTDALTYENSIIIDKGKLLADTENIITIYFSADIGGEEATTTRRTIRVTPVTSQLIWENQNNSLQNILEDLVLTWQITGEGLIKTTYLSIDDTHNLVLSKDVNKTDNQTFVLPTTDFATYNLTHGAHKFSLYAEVVLNGQVQTITAINRNILFINYDLTSDEGKMPIISCNFYEQIVKQYDPVFIPITIYHPTSMYQSFDVNLYENTTKLTPLTNVSHLETRTWIWTPQNSGMQELIIQCGRAEKSLIINVTPLTLEGLVEPSNYAFKFKASQFSSNEALENWSTDNGITASFENFDWVNGGLQTEIDENGLTRPFINIRAGSYLTLNYNLFESAAQAKGKTFKIIFKVTKCKNYDAEFLRCAQKQSKVIPINKIITLDIPMGASLNCSQWVGINNDGVKNLILPIQISYDLSTAAGRKQVLKRYIQYNNDIYYCSEIQEIIENDITYYIPIWKETSIVESFIGLKMQAQKANFESLNASLETAYCEDYYIEYTLDINSKNSKKTYIRTWIDGVPSGIRTYSTNDRFTHLNEFIPIRIGSEECDVQLYFVSVYEKELNRDEHLSNFIIDALNGAEMKKRYDRNNVCKTVGVNGEIDLQKLSRQNPNLRIHHYTIPRITQNKDDKIKNCKYEQYQNGNIILKSSEVTTRVQGTSSAAYGLAAYNLDSDFTDANGVSTLYTGDNKHLIDGWSMDENAIPCTYFTTKVNVASVEQANNAINQEWYNKFQPYKSILRCKNPKARDTMQFTPGVLFLTDENKIVNNTETLTMNNVFSDTNNYVNAPYPKLYSICNMGNSKKNTHVFHDSSNLNADKELQECCVEVSDNQAPQQWMVTDDFTRDNIDTPDGSTEQEYFAFRFPDKIKNASDKMVNAWFDFVRWMAQSNPQPMYEELIIHNEEEFLQASINLETQQPVQLYTFENTENGVHETIDAYDVNITKYYKKTPHVYGYTNEKLPDDAQKTFEPYTFQAKGLNAEIQKDYTPIMDGFTISKYSTIKIVNKPVVDDEGNPTYDKVTGEPIYTKEEQNVPYEYDTYEYRMAKMLEECEEHLVMDSIIFHYLFIERHCMIDNVAKNTFWSTDDLQHWNLIKDYDNDTADGNDNNGAFTRNYGMEPQDQLNAYSYVFNAHQAVWMNFINGLPEACEHMYKALDTLTDPATGNPISAWDPIDYLSAFKEWQNVIPEKCWIESCYRLYERPDIVYNDSMFLDMLEGGKKTHQRQQFEIYQNYYISSKYNGKTATASRITIRGSGTEKLGYQIPVKMYSDCYIAAAIGSGSTPNVKIRAKRNQEYNIVCPFANINNATIYFFSPSRFSSIKKLGGLGLERLELSGATKLIELEVGNQTDQIANSSLPNFTLTNNDLLERLYVDKLSVANFNLDLTSMPNLKELYARESAFTGITIADNAPLNTLAIEAPQTIILKNLLKMQTFEMSDAAGFASIEIDNIDNSSNLPNLSKIISNKLVPDQQSTYKLFNIKWTLDKDDLPPNDKELIILPLEKLQKYSLGANYDEANKNSSALSLNGLLVIPSDVYNNSSSLDLYHKYSRPDAFPYLDMEFEGNNAKLYNVEIHNGDNAIVWTNKLLTGDKIDESFLKDSNSPFGPLNLEQALFISDSPAHTYTFNNQWNVYKKEDTKQIYLTTLNVTSNTDLPFYDYIDLKNEDGTYDYVDIILQPVFEQTPRNYIVSFFSEGTLIEQKTVQYGTTFRDVLDTLITIPEKEYTGNVLTGAYNFKGYSSLQGSSILVDESYVITNHKSFYAVFELLDDISTVVHYDWFEYEPYGYDEERTDISTILLSNEERIKRIAKEDAWLIKPKTGLTLKGKVTIPAYYQNKPIIALSSFNKQHVTHVFFEKVNNEKHPLKVISENAFYESSYIQYVDFKNTQLRQIEANAFWKCTNLNISNFKLNDEIIAIGDRAFAGAFNVTDITITIQIPANLRVVGNRGFANFNGTNTNGNWTLRIGTEENKSLLNLAFDSLISSSSNNHQPFRQNSKVYDSVEFYTEKYTNNSVINEFPILSYFENANGFTVNPKPIIIEG